MPNSAIQGLSMRGIGMHQRFGVNLLAVDREGHAARTRLKHIKNRTGVVLLLQGATQGLEQLCLNPVVHPADPFGSSGSLVAALSLATRLSLPTDPFLMAVATGAVSPYLTPIGHQSNTLVMGPGGYRFGDYWRVGLPVDIVILVVTVPMISWVWM